MKIKSDFVTNSSSSSFIIVFPFKVKSLEQVKQFIAEKYAKIVLNDCLVRTPLRLTGDNNNKKLKTIMIRELSYGTPISNRNDLDYSSCMKDFCRFNNISRKDLYSNRMWYNQFSTYYNSLQNEVNKKISEEFLNKLVEYRENAKLKSIYIYVLNYGDENGEVYAEMEHNNIFYKLPFMQISHH